MPTISMFYGILVMLFFEDNRRHKGAHIHVEYQKYKAVLGIPDARLLEGKFPPAKLKIVQAWVEIHRDELMADWALAARGQPVFNIEPLR